MVAERVVQVDSDFQSRLPTRFFYIVPIVLLFSSWVTRLWRFSYFWNDVFKKKFFLIDYTLKTNLICE